MANTIDIQHGPFKLIMILIQQLLRIHFYSNPTDKNLNGFLCRGGLK